MLRFLAAVLLLLAISTAGMTQTTPTSRSDSIKTIAQLKDFPVVELRRYAVREGERER